jgi:hypothetical protein
MAVFLKSATTSFKCFQKIKTKILYVDNVEIHKPAKSQFKILCILGYKKKTKLTFFFEIVYCSTTHIYIFVFFAKP